MPAVRVLTLRVCEALSRERSERDEQHLEHVRERVFDGWSHGQVMEKHFCFNIGLGFLSTV